MAVNRIWFPNAPSAGIDVDDRAQIDIGYSGILLTVIDWASINQILKKSKVDVFRRCSIRRRLGDGTGEWETDWMDISDYIKKWGNVSWKLDDKKINFFTQKGMNITVKNDDGAFLDETQQKSLWHRVTNDAGVVNKALTRYRTLVKVEAGFLDPDNGAELLTPSELFFGYMSENFRTGDRNVVNIKIKPLHALLDELPANKLIEATGGAAGAGTLKASDLLKRIKTYSDGGRSAGNPDGNYILTTKIDEIMPFSANAWDIDVTTNVYKDIDTTTALDGMSCWKLAKKLAEAEDKIVYIDDSGKFNFKSRTVAAGDPSYTFIGHPHRDSTYGHTIKTVYDL